MFPFLMENIERVKPRLSYTQIVPTNACNVRCIFCWRSLYPEEEKRKMRDRISDERLVEIAKEVRELGPKRITITGGGEPLVKKHVVLEMIKEIKRHPSIKAEIVTNGCLFDDDLVRELVANRLDIVGISINSSKQELDDFIRGKERGHEQLLRGLEYFRKWKTKLNIDVPALCFTMVVTKYNYDDVKGLAALAARYDIRNVNVRWVFEPGHGEPSQFVVPKDKYEEFVTEVREAEELARSNGISFSRDFSEDDVREYLGLNAPGDCKENAPEDPKELLCANTIEEEQILSIFEEQDSMKINEKLCKIGVCTYPFYELFIDANGYASCCGALASAGGKNESVEIVEDVTKSSIQDIWYGEKFNKLRANMILRKFPHPCKGCNVNLVKVCREWYQRWEEFVETQ